MTPTYASQREKHPPNLSGLKRSVDVCDAPRLSRLTEGLCSSSSLQGPDPATSWRTPAAQQKRPIPPTPSHTHPYQKCPCHLCSHRSGQSKPHGHAHSKQAGNYNSATCPEGVLSTMFSDQEYW